jgi:hypothetical protein
MATSLNEPTIPRTRGRNATLRADQAETTPAPMVKRINRTLKKVRLHLTLDANVVASLSFDASSGRIRKTASQRANEILSAHYRQEKGAIRKRVMSLLDPDSLDDLVAEMSGGADAVADVA